MNQMFVICNLKYYCQKILFNEEQVQNILCLLFKGIIKDLLDFKIDDVFASVLNI